MKEIVNSTQGVESVKGTSKQWIARMTKKRWVAVVALSLCFVFCMSFGLQAMFRDRIEPQNEALEQRFKVYQSIQNQMQEELNQSRVGLTKLAKASIVTDAELDFLLETVDNYVGGLFDLIDSNVGANEIVEYYHAYFTPDLQNKMEGIASMIDARLADSKIYGEILSQNQEIGVRGSKHIGTYASNNKSGIDWLNQEARRWDGVLFCIAALAIVGTIMLALAAAPTGGITSVFIAPLIALSIAAGNIAWGLGKEASKGATNASELVRQGYGYSVYIQTGIFGITSGYSVYRA